MRRASLTFTVRFFVFFGRTSRSISVKFSMLSGAPPWVIGCSVADYAARLEALLRSWRPDVVQMEFATLPSEIDLDGIAGDAGLRSGQHAVFAEQPVHQRGLAGVRPPDHGDSDWAHRVGSFLGSLDRLARDVRQGFAKRLEQIDQPLAVLGRDADRIAETEFIGFHHPRAAAFALGLVGHHDHRLAGAAHQIGEGAVLRHRSGLGVEHEEHRVGLPVLLYPAFGLMGEF